MTTISEIVNLYVDMSPCYPLPCAITFLIEDCMGIVTRKRDQRLLTQRLDKIDKINQMITELESLPFVLPMLRERIEALYFSRSILSKQIIKSLEV